MSFWLIQFTSDPTQHRGRQELRPRRWKRLVGGVTQQVRAASRSEPGPPGSQHFQVQGWGLSSCVRLTKDGLNLPQLGTLRCGGPCPLRRIPHTYPGVIPDWEGLYDRQGSTLIPSLLINQILKIMALVMIDGQSIANYPGD